LYIDILILCKVKNGGFIMAKIIKRVGIVFFVLVISFLLILGCMFALNATSDMTNNLNSADNNLNQVQTVATPPQVDDSFVFNWQGSDEEIATQLSNARKVSRESSVICKLILMQDIKITSSIYIFQGEKILIDLNGHTIDRGQTQAVSYSSCFYVHGVLFITDSKFVANADNIKAQVKNIYENKGAKTNAQIIAELSTINCGKITAGMTTGHGGAINIKGTTEVAAGQVYFYGGMIYNCNSTSDSGGGGIYGYYGSALYFYDGIIAASFASRGGAVSIDGKCTITNGLFVGNSATLSTVGGGAIYIDGGANTLSDIEVLYNDAVGRGGGLYLRNGIHDIDNVKINNNQALYAAGMYINQNARVDINTSEINNNLADTFGGGVYITDVAFVMIENSTIDGNRALNKTTEVGAGGLQVNYKSVVFARDINVRNNYSNTDGGGISVSRDAKLHLAGNLDISGNTIDSGASDLFIIDRQVNIYDKITLADSSKKICVKLGYTYDRFTPFTTGYAFNGNSDVDPSTIFYTDDTNAKAVLKNGEVLFEYFTDSVYDFVYLQDGYRKAYKNNNKIHGYNDSELERYVLGNIKPNTSVNEFVNNLAPLGIDKNNLQLSDSKGKTIYQNGAVDSGINSAIADNGKEMAIGTGWCIQTNGETIYLSVLGDVNGDGRISASDVSYLREIASDTALYESLSVEKKLASMVINKGEITTADAEIVRNVIDKIITIKLFY